MRILFTAGGSPGNELIFKKLKNVHEFWFVDSDIERISSSIPLERKIEVPLVSSMNYYKKIVEFCIEKKIQILVPGIDEELLRMHEAFSQTEDIKLFTPSKLFISNMLDKFICMSTLEKSDFPVPETTKLENIINVKYFPVILKPRYGRGSRGIHIISQAKELELYRDLKLLNKENYICQSFVVGQEYTVQILNCKKSRKQIIIPLKVFLKKGVTLTAEIDFDDDIIKLCKKIASSFNEDHVYNIQLIKSKDDNAIKIFEINPRFSTTTCMIAALGIDPFTVNLSKEDQSNLKKFQGLRLNRILTNNVR